MLDEGQGHLYAIFPSSNGCSHGWDWMGPILRKEQIYKLAHPCMKVDTKFVIK